MAIASTGLAIWAVRARHDANLAADTSARIKDEAIEDLKEARAQARLADARRVAALSESERDPHLDRALLLAVEAIHLGNTFETRRSLLDALLTRPGVTSFLHRAKGYVTSVAFIPNGEILAAAYRNLDGFTHGGRGGVVLLDLDLVS